MSSRLDTSWVSRSDSALMVLANPSACFVVPVDLGGQQAGGRGLDRRERGAQVVGDGGQQGGAQAVGLGQLGGAGRLGLEAEVFLGLAELGDEGAEQAGVLGAQVAARRAPARRRRRARRRKGPARARSGSGPAGPGGDGPGPVGVGRQDGDAVEVEGAAQLGDEVGEGVDPGRAPSRRPAGRALRPRPGRGRPGGRGGRAGR